MKFKLLITFSICLAMYFCVSANESFINEVKFEGNAVFISGTNEDADNTITAKVLPASSEESSVADAVLVKEIKSNDDGSFQFSFVMLDEKNGQDTSGDYKVYMNFGEGEVLTKEFNFVSSTIRSEVLKTLQKSDVSGIKTLLEDKSNEKILNGIGIQLDEFEALGANKEKSITLLLQESDLSDMGEFEVRDAINKAVDVTNLETCSLEEAEKHLLDLNSVFKETAYGEITDESLKIWIKTLMIGKEFTSYKAYDTQYSIANALYLINNARYSQLKNIIAENDAIFNLLENDAYQDYLNMSETNQRKVDEQVVLGLNAKPVYTVTDFVKLYEEEIETLLDSSKSSSSSGGGGSSVSSSGKKSGGTIYSPINSENVAEPEQETDSEVFWDLDGYDWAKEAIDTLKEKNIISGYPDGSFMPSREVSREEFVKMLILALGITEFTGENSFSDVSLGSWYEPYINTAVDKGIVTGISGESFGIGSGIQRQQMAVMVYRASEGKRFTSEREYSGFADEEKIADYAKEAVKALYSAGKINGIGDNVFAPEDILTRAEAAQIIYEVFCR